ncbi:MAG: hypothetical protein A2X49_06990 [Lentisphaerae bacterium GWF2_52_8]|nr:MAG: hypothetical protein A2X49_06990 [Lentisphaerae bacterium GWF2_52_8]
MNEQGLLILKEWFNLYTQAFRKSPLQERHPIEIKWKHSFEVCGLCADFARGIGLPPEKVNLAEAAGLCHDVGRFEQYTRYGTFMDQKSENHAILAVKILRDTHALSHIPQDEAESLLLAVENHNKAILPRLPGDASVVCRILRDADKLDIWRILEEYYRDRENGIENPSVELELPEIPGLSAEICAALLEGRCAEYRHMRSSNDFKLLQIAWIYDLNFIPSFLLLREKRYLDTLRLRLPSTPVVDRIHREASNYLEERLAAS